MGEDFWSDRLQGRPYRDAAARPRTGSLEGVACFAGDLPEAEQKLVWATHAAPAADLFNQKVEGTVRRSKPSWYIVATKDRTVQSELHRFVAKRMGVINVETASSHVPMLSNLALVLDVIRKAANAVEKA